MNPKNLQPQSLDLMRRKWALVLCPPTSTNIPSALLVSPAPTHWEPMRAVSCSSGSNLKCCPFTHRPTPPPPSRLMNATATASRTSRGPFLAHPSLVLSKMAALLVTRSMENRSTAKKGTHPRVTTHHSLLAHFSRGNMCRSTVLLAPSVLPADVQPPSPSPYPAPKP